MLGWLLLSAPLWMLGAIAPNDARLGWWAAAASIDLAGTWLAHPSPGRKLHSEFIDFDAEHMMERLRLFLIIALGEVVLTLGTAVAGATLSPLVVVASSFALSTLVSLWALYFAASDPVVSRHISGTTNPILAARLATNGMVVVVAGLIALAVANEVVIAHPAEHPSGFVAMLMTAGAASYLLVQGWYLRFLTGSFSKARFVAIVAVLGVGAVAPMVPAVVALGMLAVVLFALWMVLSNGTLRARTDR
jgi:low temperature requirement protein LtrA